MRNVVNTYVEKFRQSRQMRRRIVSIVAILAVVVSVGVLWELHSDGVAMANETYCGMEEHQHDGSCYETVLVCGEEAGVADEAEGHTHDESCYEEVLVCEIPEHVHTIECMTDETADVETAADWEATLPKELSGNWADDVVSVAKSQVGYTESAANFQLAEDGETRQGYTRYGAWYGNAYGDWDAMFASFCLYYADVPEDEFPEASGAGAWITELNKKDLYADAADYDPAAGDIIFFDEDEDGMADHVGIVVSTEFESEDGIEADETDSESTDEDVKEEPAEPVLISLTAIEGDFDDAVYVNEYNPEDTRIVGYGVLPVNPDAPEVIAAEPEDEEIETLAYEGDGSGKVVLNLGNGNGLYNFADYSGNKNAGTALRYTTDSLVAYADDDGSVKINLPSDNNLADSNDETKETKIFNVVDAVGTEGEDGYLPAVTVNLEKELAYDYKLVGWVNIATGEYYDVSDGPTTADIDLDNENVFYADWIAASYSYGSRDDSGLRTDTVSTADFVTIHMYDYNELFNLYSEFLVQSDTTSEAWTDSGNLYSNLPYGTGDRLSSSFIFVNDGTTEQTSSSTGGLLTWPANKTAGNTWPGGGLPPRDATTIWGITTPSSAPLNMLFDPESDSVGVHYVGEADYLFWLNSDGYYTYNSKDAAATYNQSDERFYVYNGIQDVDGTNFSCFLPYNEYGDKLSVNNGSVNYWFGMDMEVNFYLPNATGMEGGNQVDGENMIFRFSGDDDIFIFIDDKLVLDMSGIHDEAFGEIDFTDGVVKMSMDDETLDDEEGTSLALSAGNHTLKVYYMERGGYASNLEIQFNVVPLWEYQTGDVQTVTAEKIWVDAQDNKIEPDDMPEVYKNNGVEVGLFDVLTEAVEATDEREAVFGYSKDGDIYTVEFTDDSGVTRTYVYDDSGPTLEYTEIAGDGTTVASGTNDQVDSSGRVLDKDGYVVVWLDGDKLHIRMDKQTLSADNNWYYAWEMLDVDGVYEVLELSGSSSYTARSSVDDLTKYYYWSIVGDTEIEAGMLDGEHPVILTEAAQEANNTLGNTSEALGWVIIGEVNGIKTEQVKFSQIATLEEIKNDDGSIRNYLGTYGVTSQSEINALGDGALWYMVDSKHSDEDVDGGEVEGFYLHCVLNGTNYYLTLDNDEDELILTTTEEEEVEFYYDSLGELMVALSDGAVRVEILGDGSISIDEAETKAAKDDVRIYTLQETDTYGFTFTAVNTFLPDITVEKVDSITGESLSGVSFTLSYVDESGDTYYYAGLDVSSNEVIWYNPEAESVGDETISSYEFKTDENGSIIFNYIPDGTYILTESLPLDGYNALPSAISFTVDNGTIIQSVSWTDNDITADINSYVTISTDGVTITVENQSSAELPNTGGFGTTLYTMAGLLLMCGAAYLLYIRNCRKRRYEKA